MVIKYYRNGKNVIATLGTLELEEITKSEYEAEIASVNRNLEIAAEVYERTRPLTGEEVSRLLIAQQINNLIVDDATASRMVDYYPTLKQDGTLIAVNTRINWNGKLKRAAVDLWDTADNSPDNAPTLWEDILYRDGYRIIPDVITAGTAFALDELGWWGDKLYKSLLSANVYTPEQYPNGWELQE